jgi:hypothetical protein
MAGSVACAVFVSFSDYDRADGSAEAGAGTAGSGGLADGSFGGAGGTAGGGAAGAAGAAGTAGTAGTGGGGIPDAASCTDGACLPVPAAPWTGPVALLEFPVSSNQLCSGDYPEQKFEGHGTVDCGVATCQCGACSPPTNQSCAPGSGNLWSDLQCKATAKSYTTTVCTGTTGQKAVSVQAPVGSGTCGGIAALSATIPQGVFTDTLRTCGLSTPTQGSCQPSEVCAPTPTSPFEATLCIFATGDSACPAGPYSVKRLAYVSISENRSCSTCGCSAATVSCKGNLVAYSDGVCSSASLGTLDAGAGCQPFPAGTTAIQWQYTPSGGACTANSSLTGSCAGSDPTTICCLP